MFVDTNPDPSYVRDESISLPESARKRSASVSVASAEDYSSGEEEAANLVKKKVRIVEAPRDAMEANEDFVTLVFSDMEGEEDEEDDEESEAESGLEEEHLHSISRKIDPIVYQDTAQETADASDEDSDGGVDDDTDDDPDKTIQSTTKQIAENDGDSTGDTDDLADSSDSE